MAPNHRCSKASKLQGVVHGFSGRSLSTRKERVLARESTMSDQGTSDRDEKKREYNRLAQREFRRRRKDHLKRLEQLQTEQSSEQSDEISRLRAEIAELRSDNDRLRSQAFGASSSASSSSGLTPPRPLTVSYAGRRSISAGAGEGSSRQQPSLSAHTSMLSPIDVSGLHLSPTSSLDLIQGIPQGSPQSSVAGVSSSSIQSPHDAMEQEAIMSGMTGYEAGLIISPAPLDRAKARADLQEIFRPMLSSLHASTHPYEHLAVLATLEGTLPPTLHPSMKQLEMPHFYGIDMVPSPSLRERLVAYVDPDVAKGFITDVLGSLIWDTHPDHGQLTIWGDDVLDESCWEFAPEILSRWGWLLGSEWMHRANLWRRQRNAPLLS